MGDGENRLSDGGGDRGVDAGGTGDFDRAMEFLVRHPAAAEKLISHVYPMAQVEQAFATARIPEGSMKVVLSL